MPVGQIARLVAKPGCRDQAIEILQKCFDTIAEEQGNLLYVMLSDKRSVVTRLAEDGREERTEESYPDEIWFMEIYTDEAALEEHDARYDTVPLLRDEVMPGLAPLLAEPYELIRANVVRAKGLDA